MHGEQPGAEVYVDQRLAGLGLTLNTTELKLGLQLLRQQRIARRHAQHGGDLAVTHDQPSSAVLGRSGRRIASSRTPNAVTLAPAMTIGQGLTTTHPGRTPSRSIW